MSEIRLELEGALKLRDMLRAFERNAPRFAIKLAALAVDEVKRAAPVRSGQVRDSFDCKKEGEDAIVYSDWFVARLQNYGYAAHYHVLPSGAKVFIPGKAKRPEGYFVEPAVDRAVRKWSGQVFEQEVMDKL